MTVLSLASAAEDTRWSVHERRCVTSALSRDTIRCRCTNVSGYVAVLAPLLKVRIGYVPWCSVRHRCTGTHLYLQYDSLIITRSSMSTLLRSSSPVLVMISGMFVLICNHFHSRRANRGKITSFGVGGKCPCFVPSFVGPPHPAA